MKKFYMKLFYFLFFMFVLGLFGRGISNTDSFRQPVEYNHKIHTEMVGFSCLDCHLNAENRARASIPNIELCGQCHQDPDVENEELQKVAIYVEKKIEVPWIQVHMVPDHVYFSHRRHVKLGQLECSVCHGEVAQRENPFVKSFIAIEMSWCIDCHEQRLVSNDCTACHR